jgi:hypothetical protein
MGGKVSSVPETVERCAPGQGFPGWVVGETLHDALTSSSYRLAEIRLRERRLALDWLGGERPRLGQRVEIKGVTWDVVLINKHYVIADPAKVKGIAAMMARLGGTA